MFTANEIREIGFSKAGTVVINQLMLMNFVLELLMTLKLWKTVIKN